VISFKQFITESEKWQRAKYKNPEGGMTKAGVDTYRREHPGSKLKTAVTTDPSKLKAGSKSANRRKSFCARMRGVDGPMKKPNGEPTRKALALRKWHC
jgi:phage gp37-like protein